MINIVIVVRLDKVKLLLNKRLFFKQITCFPCMHPLTFFFFFLFFFMNSVYPQPYRLTKRAELAKRESSKKGADENEPYAINIELIVMKFV